MARALTLLVGLVAFVLGVGAGFLLAGAPEDTGSAPRDDAATVADDPAREPDGGRPARSEGDAKRTRRTASEPRFAAAIETIQIEIPPPGQGVVTGKVSTPSGTPVAGAEILAYPDTPPEYRRSRDPNAERPLEERVRDFVKSQRWRDAMRLRTLTAADGTYTIEGMIDLKYTLSGSATGYLLRRARATQQRVSAGETFDFVAVPQVEVPLRILLPDGTAPDRATVSFQRGNSRTSTTWSKERLSVSVAPGSYRMTVSAGEYEQHTSDTTDVELEEGEPVAEMTIQLQSRPGIAGRLVFPDGTRPSMVQLSLVPIPGDREPRPEMLESATTRTWSHPANGYTFTFADLSPARYLIGLGERNGPVIATWTVEVQDEFVTREFDVPSPDRADSVEIRAYNPDGEPLRDVHASLAYRSERRSGTRSTTNLQRPDGAVWVRQSIDDDWNEKDGRHFVVVAHPEFGEVRAEYTPGPSAAVEVRFLHPARAHVVLAGYAASDLAGRLQVTMAPLADGRGGGRSTSQKPDATGRVRFTPTSPGEHVFGLVVGSRRSHRTIADQRAWLESGDNEVTLAIPPLFTVTIEAAAEYARSRVQLRLSKRTPDSMVYVSADATLDESGRASVPDLPAGDYRVSLYARGKRVDPQTITVPQTTVVRF